MSKSTAVPPLLMPKGKMHPRPDSPPGMETDGKGNVIPLAERTREDQEKARAASIKNPNNEATDPAPMPRDQQGQTTARNGRTNWHGAAAELELR